MECIYCRSATAVKNSRLQRRSNQVWRRRICPTCSSNFTTIERPELSGAFAVGDPTVSKRKLEPLNRDKVFLAIYESCRHRPNAVDEATYLTQTVMDKVISKHRDGLIGRDTIARETYSVLKRFDAVAATFYAAYHAIEP